MQCGEPWHMIAMASGRPWAGQGIGGGWLEAYIMRAELKK